MSKAARRHARAPKATEPRAGLQFSTSSVAPERPAYDRHDPWASQRGPDAAGHSSLAGPGAAWRRGWPPAADTSRAVEPRVGHSLASTGLQRTALARATREDDPSTSARSDAASLVHGKAEAPAETKEQETQEERSATGFDGLKALVDDIAGGVKTGNFADASFKVAIPIPEVPGLSITVDASGTFSVNDKKSKELELKLGVGLKYSLGTIFDVNANFNEALSLSGNDLGAALVDAVKQSTYWALEKAGVHAMFAELVRLASEGPSFWDYAKIAIPFYGTYQAAKLAIASVGADNLITAHEAFVAFFQNDESVGFEASIGLGAGAGAEGGDMAASGTLEARAGLEDVDNKKTRGFTELAGELSGNKGNSSARVRYAKRFREGGQRLQTIEVQSALSMPKKAYNLDERQGLVRNASLLWSIYMAASSLEKAEEGGDVGDGMQLVHALLGLGSNVFGNTTSFDSLMGLDFKVTRLDGTWTVNYARIKMMTQIGTGTGKTVGGVEANVRVGKFFDVGGVLNMALAKYEGR